MFPVKNSKSKRKGGGGSERVSVPVRLYRTQGQVQAQAQSQTRAQVPAQFQNPYAFQTRHLPFPMQHGYGHINPMRTAPTPSHPYYSNNNNNRLMMQNRPAQAQAAGSWFTDVIGYCSSQQDGMRYYDKKVRSALQSIVTFQNKNQNCFGFLPKELQKAHLDNISHVTIMLEAINKAIALGTKSEADIASRKAQQIQNKIEIKRLEQESSEALQLAKAKADAINARQRAAALVQDAENKAGRKVDVLDNQIPNIVPGADALMTPLKGGFFYHPRHFGGVSNPYALRAGGGGSVRRIPYFIVPSTTQRQQMQTQSIHYRSKKKY
jgi:hypothetical protein